MATSEDAPPYEASFEKIQHLLSAKDDTSRFVGLAVLKSTLDNAKDRLTEADIESLYKSIPPKFIDKLLKAKPTLKLDANEAKSMVDLAVAVLHTFSILLQNGSQMGRSSGLDMSEKLPLLTNALATGSETSQTAILQTLLTLVSNQVGAQAFLKLENYDPLIQLAHREHLVLDIFHHAFLQAATDMSQLDVVWTKFHACVPMLLKRFMGTDGIPVLSYLALMLRELPSQIHNEDPKWLQQIIPIIKDLVVKRPTMTGRAAYTELSASLLRLYPASATKLLFGSRPTFRFDPDAKPHIYLFMNLLLVDLQAALPNLLADLNSSTYQATARRLTAAFDVVSVFINFLLHSLDDEANCDLLLHPDLLLRLRRDISQTMSLTIEYLRDRFDASLAGVMGLHQDARAGMADTSSGKHLTIVWDSMKDDIPADPLVLAALGTVALWLREDDNDGLRTEAGGLMDMLVELYPLPPDRQLDFRYPILAALEGILQVPANSTIFLDHGGWSVLATDLTAIIGPSSSSLIESDLLRGIQIVRALLFIIDDPTTLADDAWMSLVHATSRLAPPAPPATGSHSADAAVARATTHHHVELCIAMLQLASALLTKASGGLQKRHVTTYPAIRGLARQMRAVLDALADRGEAAELGELLDDVQLELGNLRVA